MIPRILLLILLSFATPCLAATDWTAHADAKATYLFNESSGNLIDQSNSNDCTAGGTVAYSQSGVFGDSINFATTGDFNCPDGADFDFTDAVTIVAYHSYDTAPTATEVIVSKRTSWGATTIPYELVILSQTGMAGRTRGNSPICEDTSAFSHTTNTFYHLAMTWDGSTITLYDEGVVELTCSQTSAIVANNTDVSLAQHPGAGGEGLDGNLDEVGIFNTALDGTDINDIMDNGLKQTVAAPPSRNRIMLISKGEQNEMDISN